MERPALDRGRWAVRVSIICFASKMSKHPSKLDGNDVLQINPDLTYQSNVSLARRLVQNLSTSFIGMQKSGPHDIDGQVARKLLRLPINPNGKSNSAILFPYLNGFDLLRTKRDKWIM